MNMPDIGSPMAASLSGSTVAAMCVAVREIKRRTHVQSEVPPPGT